MQLLIRCPFRKDHAVGLFDSHCHICDRPLSIAELRKHYAWKTKHTAQVQSLTECPRCEFVSSLGSNCPRCGLEFTITVAATSFRVWLRQQAKELLALVVAGGPHKFQKRLLAASLLGFGAILAITTTNDDGSLVVCLLVSGFYLSLIGLLLKWFVPRRTLNLITRGTSTTVKLAMLVNYLSFVLILQLLIGCWWIQALTIVGLFLITGLSAWFLCDHAWPMSLKLHQLFYGEPDSFDHTHPDGRHARND